MCNAISANIQNKLDQNRASKDISIALPKAVAKENNRSSITAAQKSGRAPKQPKPPPKPAPESALGPAPKTAQKAPKLAQKLV